MKTVVVIGGGILGSATAYQLSKRNMKVILVDREDKGQATAVAAGIVCPWLSQRRNKTWYRLVKQGASYYDELIKELADNGEVETGYAKVGALCLHTDLAKLEAMKQRAEKRKFEAPEIGDIQLIPYEEAKQKFPLLSQGFHVLSVSGAARVDGSALARSMRNIAMKNGATYIHGNAALVTNNQSVKAVNVNGQLIEPDEVVVCAGAWSNQLLAPHDINVHVTYQKGQIMHLTAEHTNETAQWPVIMPPNDQYLLAFAEGKVVVGATHENDVTNYNMNPTVAGMHEIMEKGLVTASGLSTCTFEAVKVGFRPFTANYLPVFGKVESWKNIYVANGLGSSGLTAGPYIGLQLAKLIAGETADLPLEEYALHLAVRS